MAWVGSLNEASVAELAGVAVLVADALVVADAVGVGPSPAGA